VFSSSPVLHHGSVNKRTARVESSSICNTQRFGFDIYLVGYPSLADIYVTVRTVPMLSATTGKKKAQGTNLSFSLPRRTSALLIVGLDRNVRLAFDAWKIGTNHGRGGTRIHQYAHLTRLKLVRFSILTAFRKNSPTHFVLLSIHLLALCYLSFYEFIFVFCLLVFLTACFWRNKDAYIFIGYVEEAIGRAGPPYLKILPVAASAQ